MSNGRFDLTGRVALVTGGGSGLGRQFALTLAEAGADVVVTGRRRAPLDDTAAMISDTYGRRSAIVEMDVTDTASVDAGVAAAAEALGTPQIVINNAGISREAFALQMSDADYDAVIETNLNGVYRVARAAGRLMAEGGQGGSIVNIASILGRRVAPMLAAYSAAKAGVIRLTEALAVEWVRYGIRVNAIAPGFFVTDINLDFFGTPQSDKMMQRVPMRRPGELPELDGAVLLLSSDAGNYMTGTTITVDGGHSIQSM